MSLKEIRERHEATNNTIIAIGRTNGKTLLAEANQDRAELLQLLTEAAGIISMMNTDIQFQTGGTYERADKFLSKLD